MEKMAKYSQENSELGLQYIIMILATVAILLPRSRNNDNCHVKLLQY